MRDNTKEDNGKIFSVIYFASEHQLEMQIEDKIVSGNIDSLLILKSRKVSYGLNATAKGRKAFLLRFWVCGPP